jgi:hypothetical protein
VGDELSRFVAVGVTGAEEAAAGQGIAWVSSNRKRREKQRATIQIGTLLARLFISYHMSHIGRKRSVIVPLTRSARWGRILSGLE